MVVELGAGDRERALERRRGEVRERRADGGHARERVGHGEVGGGDAQDPLAVGAAQGVHPLRAGPVGDGHRRVRVGTRRAQELGAHVAHVHPGPGGRVREDLEQRGTTHDVVAERDRGAEHREQAVTCLAGPQDAPGEVRERRVRLDVGPQRAGQPHDLQEREVRVGRPAERGEQLVVHRGRRVRDLPVRAVRSRCAPAVEQEREVRVREQARRARDVGEADAREATRERRPAGAAGPT